MHIVCKSSRNMESPAVDDPDGERRAVDLLLRQLDVQELDGGGEVWVLLGVDDDGALDDVSGALHVHAGPVHGHELDALQVAQAPEQHLESVKKW